MDRCIKESGIFGVGKIPEHWSLYKNKYLFKRKKSIVGDKCENYDLLSLTTKGIKIKDINNNTGKLPQSFKTYQEVDVNDLVLCLFDLDVSAVFSGKSDFKGMISPAYTIYECNELIKVDFAKLWFDMIGFDRKYIFYAKSLRNTINTDTFKEIVTAVPPISEQEKIIDYLDKKTLEIDNIINKTIQSIEEYKNYKKSVITECVTTGLNKNVELKESNLKWNRYIPKHWEVINPRWLFTQRKDKAFEGDEQLTASQKHGVIYQKDFMRLENQKVVLVEKDFSILKHVEPNDFVISMRSFQGGLEYSKLRGCISSAYVMLIPNDKVYSPYFRWLFKSEKYINALQSTSNLVRDGQALRYSNFVQVPLFIFSKEEQKEIADYLDKKCEEIDKLIAKKEELIIELENYKKSLIYECVTGKKEI